MSRCCSWRTAHRLTARLALRRCSRLSLRQPAPQVLKPAKVILTNAHAADSAWGNECWDAVVDLSRSRGSALMVVVLEWSPGENARHIQGLDRASRRKPRDPAMFQGNAEGRPLLGRDGDHLLRLDVTELGGEDSASRIEEWVLSALV